MIHLKATPIGKIDPKSPMLRGKREKDLPVTMPASMPVNYSEITLSLNYHFYQSTAWGFGVLGLGDVGLGWFGLVGLGWVMWG